MFTRFQENVYYLMGLIEEIGRETNNHRSFIVNTFGVKWISHVLECTDAYSCDDVKFVAKEFIDDLSIPNGDFITPKDVPGLWGVAGTYAYLVNGIIEFDEDLDSVSNKIIEIFKSRIVDIIAHYETDMFYQSPQYIRACYDADDVL